MKMVKILIVVMLLATPATFAQKIVDLAEWGVSSAEDVTPIIYDVLESEGRENLVLKFPKGVYHFTKKSAYGKYHAITNHDNIYRYFAFPLEDCKNITIDGGGSEFIFSGVITPFLIEDSENITLKNFSVDWDIPLYIQMQVLESSAQDKSMDVEIASWGNYKYESNRVALSLPDYYHPFLGENMVFDPNTNAVAYRAREYCVNGENTKLINAKKIGENQFRIKMPFAKEPAPKGMIYIFKGMNRSNRLAPAIHLIDSKGFIATDINIYHAGGMGLIGEKSEDIVIRRFNVVLREGTDRMVTTTADATHFCNCKGELTIEDCIFENMLDDATNVHGTYMRVAEVRGNVVRARLIHPQQSDYDFANVGDRVRFVEDNTILPIDENVVKSVKRISQDLYELTYEDEIPATLKAGDGIENITWYPTFTFRNNIVRNNRARSILISTPNPVLVENNSFSSMMTSILIEGDLNYWHESGGVNNVTIRNNHFKNSVYGGGKGSIIWVNPQMRKLVEGECFEKNIVIENNLFETFDNSILSARSVEGLIFRNNTIKPSTDYKPIFPDMPTINLENCKDYLIKGNKIKGKNEISITTDKMSSSK